MEKKRKLQSGFVATRKIWEHCNNPAKTTRTKRNHNLMQLIIKNLGSIETGEIDLSKKFYVFVGYNNSGKTYVSQLLWAIFNEQSIKKFSESANLETFNLADGNRFEITQNLIDNLLHQYAVFLTNKVVLDTFNVPKEHCILSDFSIAFQCDVAEISPYQWKSTVSHPIEEHEFLTFSKQKGALTINVEQQQVGNKPINMKATRNDNETDKWSVIALVDFILRLLFNDTQTPFFLPSSRLIYLAFYQYFFRLEKEKKQQIDKIFRELFSQKAQGEAFNLEALSSSMNSFKAPYTEAMNLLFEQVYKLNENAITQSHYEHLTIELSRMMGGAIVMKKSLGIAPIEFFLRMPKKAADLEMYLSSSSVNQLSTLYLYFKYWAEKDNNFLMIDEPEENLHPQHQLTLLKILLSYANEHNNRVLMTTHSPLMADMVNNYHYLAFLKSKQVSANPRLKDYPEINLDIILKLEEMGIYFFDGRQIQTYEMGDYGVFFRDFHAELKKTKDISDILTDQIYELMQEDE